MSKIQALENQLAQLQRVLASAGIGLPQPSQAADKDRADYIEHGSEQHMALLGLVYVDPGDKATYITRESGGKVYRLEDEITAFMHYNDPKQVAALVLRQKIGELEAGAPKVPADAPAIWTPISSEGETWTREARV